jgi:hypothetical protein
MFQAIHVGLHPLLEENPIVKKWSEVTGAFSFCQTLEIVGGA